MSRDPSLLEYLAKGATLYSFRADVPSTCETSPVRLATLQVAHLPPHQRGSASLSASVMAGYYGDVAVVQRLPGKSKTLAFGLDSSQNKCGQILPGAGTRGAFRA